MEPMDFSRLTYEEFVENRDYWEGEKGVHLPQWSEEISRCGFPGVSAIDFYGDIFKDELEDACAPEDYKTGQYGGILLEIEESHLTDAGVKKWEELIQDKKISARITKKKINGKYVNILHKPKRYTVTRDHEIIYKKLQSDNFLFMSPMSYAGKQRSNKNARYLFALCIEIDDIKEGSGIEELVHTWKRSVSPVPVPTFIVCSGNGVHLYWVFEKPIPMFANIFAQVYEAKTYLTRILWSEYVTKSADKVQYESLGQGFRCVGSVGKKKDVRVMAFKVGGDITLEYLNSFLPDEKKINKVYQRTGCSLEQAKELYPDWYNRRIVKKDKNVKVFSRHRGIYDNWIEKILEGGAVGHRYNCLENLCSLAVQCNIPPEEVEKDCRRVAEHFEKLTVSPDNHFTEFDVICALQTYHRKQITAYLRNIDYISKKTNIPLPRAKRNGRKQEEHLKRARAVRDIDHPNGSWRGNPSKLDLILSYVRVHPDDKPAQVAKSLGISRSTVYAHWKKIKNVRTFDVPYFDDTEEYIMAEPEIKNLEWLLAQQNRIMDELDEIEEQGKLKEHEEKMKEFFTINRMIGRIYSKTIGSKIQGTVPIPDEFMERMKKKE